MSTEQPGPNELCERVSVLLVDDNPNNRTAIEAALSGLDLDCVQAQSGEEALRICLDQDFAVILLDVQMPTMDGFETAKLVRQRARSQHTPILFVTSYAQTGLDKMKGYAIGAVDYLPAPIVPEILRAKVRVFVDLYKAQRTLRKVREELEQRVQERTAELHESRERLERLVDQLADVVWSATLDGKHITEVNQSFERTYGIPCREFLAKPTLWIEMVHPDDRHVAEQSAKALYEQGSAFAEYRIVRPDGQVRWLHDRKWLIRDGSGRPVQMSGIGQDITERKRAETDMERMRILLMEGQRIAHVGSFEYIVATGETVWSDEEFQIYGLEPGPSSPSYADLMLKHFHPDDAARVDQQFAATLKNCTAYEIEHRIVRPDGTVRDLYNAAQPYFDAEGRLVKYMGATIDITERKRAEEMLRREQDFSNALLESTAEGVVACDANGTLALFNRAAREWHGMDALALPPEEWSRHYDLYEADGRTPLRTEAIPLMRAFRGETVRDVEMQIHAKGQPSRLVLASGGPLFDADGSKLGAVAVMRDVTERRRAEEQIYELNRDLERRVQERTAELDRTVQALAKQKEEVEVFNRAMVGREMRIIELKEEVNRLAAELGREPVYTPVWRDQDENPASRDSVAANGEDG